LIAGDLLTLGRAVHVVTAFNIPHVLTRTPCIVRVGRMCWARCSAVSYKNTRNCLHIIL